MNANDPRGAHPGQVPARLQPSALQAVTPPRPPGLSAAPDAMALLKALRRRLGLALGMGLTLAALVGASAWGLVPRAKYTASATLHVATNPKRIIFEPKDNRADYRIYQVTQIALVKNQKIITDALRGLGDLVTIKEQVDPDEWLGQQLRVEFPGGSEILEVSLSGDHPEDLATIVNAVIKSYMTLVVEEERRERVARLDKLRDLWTRYQSDLNLKRKELRDMVATVGMNDKKALALAQQFKAEHLAAAQKEQLRARSEMLRAQAELAATEARYRQAGEASPTEAEINAVVDRSQAVVEQTAHVNRLAQRYQEARRRVRNEADPSLTTVLSQWRPAARQLEETRARERRSAIERFREQSGQEARASLAGARSQVNLWRTYQEVLGKEIGELQEATREIAGQSQDLDTRQAEIAIAGDVAQKVGAEIEAVEVELGAPERVELLSRAKVPKKKDELRQFKVSGGAAMATFASILLGVSFWEFRARRVSTADEVVNGLGIKLVGALPALPKRPRRRPSAAGLPAKDDKKEENKEDKRWKRLLVESVDATRAMLLHRSRIESLRVVMVTSAVSGEAKTTLASHLATSLARAGRRTLLVDCDLRNPSAHRLLGLASGPGLCEFLRGESGLDGVILETGAEGLHLLPAGRCDALALQAISRDDLRAVFETLKRQYDFIIVDSAPILLVADSLPVGQSVDAVLFSILRDVSRLPLVYSAYERLEGLGVRMLGAVVTGIQSELYSPAYLDAGPQANTEDAR